MLECLDQAGFAADEVVAAISIVEDSLAYGINEFVLSKGCSGLSVYPLRMGYETPVIDFGDGSMFWHLQVQNGCLQCCHLKAVPASDLPAMFRRLPKLPSGQTGQRAIVRQVTRVLGGRILGAFEPPWPKDDPCYWPCWARYCLQGEHPTLGVWLSLAQKRLEEAKLSNAV